MTKQEVRASLMNASVYSIYTKSRWHQELRMWIQLYVFSPVWYGLLCFDEHRLIWL